MPPLPVHRSRTVAQAASDSASPPTARNKVVVRQSEASTATRNGACPNTPPAIPIAMASPENMAKRSARNHCPATAIAPTRLKAADAPIRKRPAITMASEVPVANSTHPAAQTRVEMAISRRGPKRSSRRPTGTCMPA
jgi:hypothetical protein